MSSKFNKEEEVPDDFSKNDEPLETTPKLKKIKSGKSKLSIPKHEKDPKDNKGENEDKNEDKNEEENEEENEGENEGEGEDRNKEEDKCEGEDKSSQNVPKGGIMSILQIICFMIPVILYCFKDLRTNNSQDSAHIIDLLSQIHKLDDYSLATIINIINGTKGNKNEKNSFLTLFGDNETELFLLADYIGTIINKNQNCKIILNHTYTSKSIVNSVRECKDRDFDWPYHIRNLNTLTGDTATVLHRYSSGIESEFIPSFFLATFTTTTHFLSDDTDKMKDFARSNLELIFADVNIDSSTKVINRLLADYIVLKSKLKTY